jgi:hypothetical protein
LRIADFWSQWKAGKGNRLFGDGQLDANLQIRNPQSAIRNPRRLFFVDSLVPRKNRIEVSGQGACAVAKGFYREIMPVCLSKAHADKKSYSENEMCEKWRKYECANIDNAECPPSYLRGAEGR